MNIYAKSERDGNQASIQSKDFTHFTPHVSGYIGNVTKSRQQQSLYIGERTSDSIETSVRVNKACLSNRVPSYLCKRKSGLAEGVQAETITKPCDTR
jgi:hypothetical protein